jgi:enolase
MAHAAEQVVNVAFRGILESRGHHTMECELTLASGATGRASVPKAIAPGRHEAPARPVTKLGDLSNAPEFAAARTLIEGRTYLSQEEFDAELPTQHVTSALGANAWLALSVAFCRARAKSARIPLVSALGAARVRLAMPRPVANVFSGGIHAEDAALSFQNIMISPDLGTLSANIDAILRIYLDVEGRLKRDGLAFSYSASSGMLVPGLDHWRLLERLEAALERCGYARGRVAVAIDVAAEHLVQDSGSYRLGGRLVSSTELGGVLLQLADRHTLCFLEDVFDSDDHEAWRQLRRSLGDRVLLVGDDVFATCADRVDAELAGGILLKPTQIGTVSAALATAHAARARGLVLCVSHRSGETEDPFVCDFAVAVGARFIKLGGPRRGDRTLRYNQLLRLEEFVRAAGAGTSSADTLQCAAQMLQKETET